ncbi:FAD-dependent oxidoreductase [Agarilytica rhodophyticola]|uniref:FAD-dependent oxidoreductase n=1 Tax=Agarilytica rhodophyticola TaxID=1737490 RepID=UPI000B349D0F|nr:FAD-dependent oxidoreductase [Agarilytica rhodophyticola]
MSERASEAITTAASHSPKESEHYDVVVVNSGLQGVSIACEAASRNLKTLLVSNCIGESSYPTGIYGDGLNNLKNFHLASLISNFEELANMYKRTPHLVRPIHTYVVGAQATPSLHWRSMMKFYNWLQRKKIPSIASEEQNSNADQAPVNELIKITTKEFSINFNRIEIAYMQQLQALGGDILQDHQLLEAQRQDKQWRLVISKKKQNNCLNISSSILINCNGCHTDDLLKQTLAVKTRSATNHQRVSALIFIRHQSKWNSAVALQQAKQAFVYAYPISAQHICVGPVSAEHDSSEAKEKALAIFISLWNQHFNLPLNRDDIIHSQWTSQAVLDDPSCRSSYVRPECYLDLNNPGNLAPLLNVFGANMIQHRHLAQQALDILIPFTQAQADAQFINTPLPGGDFEQQPLAQLLAQFYQRYSTLPKELITRLFYTYGTNLLKILGNSQEIEDLGYNFGHHLYEAEVRYLLEYEWARNHYDILWRHTFLGLSFDKDQQETLNRYLSSI